MTTATLPPPSNTPGPQITSIVGFAAVLTILVGAIVAVLLLCICYGLCRLHNRPVEERVSSIQPTSSSRRNSISLPSPHVPKPQSALHLQLQQRTPTHYNSFPLPSTSHSTGPPGMKTKSASFNHSPLPPQSSGTSRIPYSSSVPRLYPPELVVLKLAETPCGVMHPDYGWQPKLSHTIRARAQQAHDPLQLIMSPSAAATPTSSGCPTPGSICGSAYGDGSAGNKRPVLVATPICPNLGGVWQDKCAGKRKVVAAVSSESTAILQQSTCPTRNVEITSTHSRSTEV